MDINDFLNNGVTVSNPNFKKPTKKNPSGSPKFVQSDNFDQSQDRSSAIGDFLGTNSYDLTGLNNHENQYDTHNVRINPVNSQEELDQSRANNQSALEQTGRFAVQSVGNEIVLGTALGLSNLVDVAASIGKKAGENDYSSPFSNYLEGLQNDVKQRFDIYQKDPNDKFAIGDYGWWASNAVSIASTLSLLIPSIGVEKGLGYIASLGKLDKVSMGIAKAAQWAGATDGAATLATAINSGAEIGTSALLSRTMENYQEARGTYKDVYQSSTDKLKNMSADDRKKLLTNNPDFVGMTDDQIAKRISGLSADETFKNDYTMLLMDMVQFKALGSMWKGVANKEVGAGLAAANRTAIAGLAGETGEAAATKTIGNKIVDRFQHVLEHPLTAIEAAQLSEGVEEGYQGIQQEKGKEVAAKIFDPNYQDRDLSSYAKDGSIWEQAFWGALGGIAFGAAGRALGNAAEAVKGKYNKSRMTEQEYAVSQMSDEKIREQEIAGRKARMQDYVDSMNTLNDGRNPYEFVLDPDTKQPILNDGNKVNQNVSQEEADQLKTKLTNDFVTNMTMDAIDKGNLDLFKSYISDPKFSQFFDQAGVQDNVGDKTFGQLVADKMNHVEENYHQSLYDVLNSVDVQNENVAKIVARDIARRKLDIDDLNRNSDDLANRLSDMADNGDYLQYEENERVKYAQDRLNEIANKEDQIKELLTNKQISPQAAEQISKDNNVRRNQLLAFGSANNMFGNPDAIKDILKNNINNADTNGFIKQFNDFLDSTGYKEGLSKATTPKKSMQDIIKKKIALDDHSDYIEKTLPSTQANYQSEYDDIARQVDRLTINRYNAAADAVSKYIEDNPNLDEARDNIMTNNVSPELKAQLDILKLGHHSTQRYTSQINALIREVVKDRNKTAEEARNVTVDNSTSNDTKAASEINDVSTFADQTDNRPDVSSTSSTGESAQTNTSDTVDTSNTDQQVTPEENTTTQVNPETFVPIQGNELETEVANLDKVNEAIEAQRAQDFILDNDSRAVGLASSITFNLFATSRNLFNNLEGKDVNSAEFNKLVDAVSDELFVQGVSRGYTKQAAIDGLKLALSTIYRRLNARGVSNAETFKRLADEVATKFKVDIVRNTPSPAPDKTTLKYADIKLGDKVIQGTKQGSITKKDKGGVEVTFDTGGSLVINNLNNGAVDIYSINSEGIAGNLQDAINKLKGNNEGITDVSNSTTRLIPDNQFNQVIEQFVDSYIANRGVYTVKGSKTIINVEDLFKELLNNDAISYEQAKHIFFNISDYIRTPDNKKYIFTNRTELNKNLKTPITFFSNLINNKTTNEIIDNYMHIAAPSKIDENYNKSLREAINGGDINVSYTSPFGYNENSISIQRGNTEIGYLGAVQPNNTNTGYSLKKQNVGFVYNLNTENGIINSNLDKLFIPLINKQTQQYSDLMDIAYKHFAYTTAVKNNNISDHISENEVKQVMNTPIIKEIINNGDIKFPGYTITERQKAQYLLTNINNILFYDTNAVTTANIIDSYSYWKTSTYNNYLNTHKIQQALSNQKKITTKLVNIVTGKVLIDTENHDINSVGFTYEQNPIMIVNANGNIINESNNNSYSNIAGFEPGTMGMLLTDNPNAPIMALFTEANKLSTNSDLANRTYNELTNLLSDFQTKDINFDTLGNRLSNLFSGPGVASNNLYSGYSVIKTADRIALNIQGQKGQYNLIVHKFEKGNRTEGTGLTYIPNGDKSKAISTITNSKTVNNRIAKEIVSNLSFNKTFYAINNKNIDNEKSNQYLYKKDGKLIVDIGDKVDSYNSFGHFVLSNNAFKTNQGINKDGSYFDVSDRIKSLYIDTAIANSPVEESNTTGGILTATDIIKSATKTNSVNTSQILTRAGIANDKIDILTGTNEFNIELIPKESYYDNKATKAEAYYSNGKMYFTEKGANAISRSTNNLVRLLIHENLHDKFDKQGLFQRASIVDDLINTYQTMFDAVYNDINNADKTSDRYKQASIIRDWLATNKFNPNEYFTTLSAEQQRIWDKRSQDERNRQFAEEWLVESLTQPTIIKYLNDTIYNGEDISVEGIDNSAKSIWQKIIDVLLKLFGKNSSNIKNNTILAQQYSILGNVNDAITETQTITDQITDRNAADNTPGQTSTDDINNTNDTESINPDEAIQTDTRKLDEQSDVDDLDFAVTDLADDPDNINIQDYRNDPSINMNGVQVVTDMNKYLDQFNETDKPIIAKMLNGGEVKFRCE